MQNQIKASFLALKSDLYKCYLERFCVLYNRVYHINYMNMHPFTTVWSNDAHLKYHIFYFLFNTVSIYVVKIFHFEDHWEYFVIQYFLCRTLIFFMSFINTFTEVRFFFLILFSYLLIFLYLILKEFQVYLLIPNLSILNCYLYHRVKISLTRTEYQKPQPSG